MSNRIQWTIEGPVTLLGLSHLLGVAHPSLMRSFTRFTANAAPIKIEAKPVTVPDIHAGRTVKTYELNGLTALAFLAARNYGNRCPLGVWSGPMTLLQLSHLNPKAKHCFLYRSFERFAAHFPGQIHSNAVTVPNGNRTRIIETLELDPLTIEAFNYYRMQGGRLPPVLLSFGTAHTIKSAENGAKGRD